MNSRIKDVPGIPGAKTEAIADTIILRYDPVAQDMELTLSFRDYLTDSDGVAVGFANDKYDQIVARLDTLGLRDVGEGLTGAGSDEPLDGVLGYDVVNIFRKLTDDLHNERAALAAEVIEDEFVQGA